MTDIDNPTKVNFEHLIEANDRQRERINKLIEERDAAYQRHIKDVQTIGHELIREATERGWCAEYDEFVTGLNENLYISLPLREKEYTVTRVYKVTVTTNVTVLGDNAIEDEIPEISFHDANEDWEIQNVDEHSTDWELA